MKIKLYSTPTCPYCVQAKKFFEGKKIDFEEIDISQNQESAEEMIKISGQMGVPVITINDEIITGFDEEKINNLIKSNE